MDSTAGQNSRLSRRRFLVLAVAGVAGSSLLAACGGGQPAPTAAPAKPTEAAKPAAAQPTSAASKPAAPAVPAATTAAKPAQAAPAFAGGGDLGILVRASFVPAYDVWLDKFATDWGARNKVNVTVDHLQAGELPSKIAAEVAAAGGHDLYGITQTGGINLYSKTLVDVTDIAKQIGEQGGGWIAPLAEQVAVVDGAWKGVPDYFYDFPALYRKDLFDANGLQPVDTYDDLLKAGTILKEKGHPIGLSLNQKTNDSNNSWSTLLWSFGGSITTSDGKSVALDSKETREALAFGVELYNKTMTDAVLAWDDSANNQYLASGVGPWIQNPISALRTIEKANPELAKNIYISNTPAGPKGRFAAVSTGIYGIMNWSKNVPAAKAFLTEFFAVHPESVKASEGFNQPLLKNGRKKPMPILGEDPKLNVLQDFDQYARVSGHPGPPSQAAAEVDSQWIIPLMFARAIQANPDEALSWALQKIEPIYAKYR
jgi:multiple sugar transport system substrate-binding protein